MIRRRRSASRQRASSPVECRCTTSPTRRPRCGSVCSRTLICAVRGMTVEQIDRRRADEARDEQRRGPLVELLRGALLLDAARVHDDDAVGHRRRLDLVVRHEDRRHTELALDAADLGAHREAQRRVEIRQRLVEQQQMRPLDESARERDALLLAARELARAPVEQRVDPHQRRDLAGARAPPLRARPS